jgi:hypothetical protein
MLFALILLVVVNAGKGDSEEREDAARPEVNAGRGSGPNRRRRLRGGRKISAAIGAYPMRSRLIPVGPANC